MAIDRLTHRSSRQNISGSLRVVLIALGLIAAGIVAINVAENLGQPHAVATAAPQSFASTSNSGTNAPEVPSAMDDYLSSSLYDKTSSPMSGPRECRPEQGIVDDCTYQ